MLPCLGAYRPTWHCAVPHAGRAPRLQRSRRPNATDLSSEEAAAKGQSRRQGVAVAPVAGSEGADKRRLRQDSSHPCDHLIRASLAFQIATIIGFYVATCCMHLIYRVSEC